MTSKRMILLLAFCLALGATLGSVPVGAADQIPATEILLDVKAEGKDSSAVLSWRFDAQKARAAGVRGVNLYRITTGDEAGFNVKPVKLVQDCKMGTEYVAKGLENGALYNFLFKLYDDKGELQSAFVLPVLPGTASKGSLKAVQHVYAASGEKAVSVFWAPSTEASIKGYEVARKSGDDAGYQVLAVVPKMVGMKHPSKDASNASYLPALRASFHRDETVKPGVSYSYRIRPVGSQGAFGPEAVTSAVQTRPARSPEPGEVLLLAVDGDEDSLDVARHYARKRNIPPANILKVKLPRAAHLFRCDEHVVRPVREHLIQNGLAGKIRVIVSCFGLPLGDGWRSLDSMLTDPFRYYSWGRTMGTDNPLFNSNAHFDGTAGVYLVARLDGPDKETAKSLVDKAMKAESGVTPSSGSAFFVADDKTAEAARRHGVKAVSDSPENFRTISLSDDTMWMFAWGSVARKLRNSAWPAGSVAAVLKSDSCVEIREKGVRSWVHSLLSEGVTATFGAVVEPYVQGFTRGDIFFDRFWSGKYTFAESFLMATPTVRWAMSAVGDPLYKLGKHQQTD